jgi:hypothetical protein
MDYTISTDFTSKMSDRIAWVGPDYFFIDRARIARNGAN